MKRVFIFLSILLSIILAIPSVAFATPTPATDEALENRMNERSSAYIDPTVLEELNLGPSDRIVKVYNMEPVSAFSEYSNIEEIMNSEYARVTFHAIMYSTGKIKFYTSGGLKTTENSLFNRGALTVYFDEDIIKMVSQDINVYNVYYLSGATYYQGTALYYETDMGDYVYYSAHGGLLMPSAAFFDYMKSEYNDLYSSVNRGEDGFGGGTNFDVSPYVVNSSSFDPGILTGNLNVKTDAAKPDDTVLKATIIAASAVLASTAVGGIFWKHKKHNA